MIGEGVEVLVTGGAGFIGSHTVDHLIERGCNVTVLDNLDTGKIENLSQHVGKEGFNFIKGDVCKPEDVEESMRGCGVVIHDAAVVGVRHYVENPLKVMEVNIFGTHNVLEAARKLDVDRVILISTSEVYGKNAKLPLREDDDRLLGPTRINRWCYSTAKAVDEHLCFAYHSRYGLRTTILRYFNAYGPRQECSVYGGVIARFISQVLNGKPPTVFGDGKQSRCFTYVSDIVEGTMLAAENDKAVGEVFNLGSEHEISILDLANLIIKIAGVEGRLKPVLTSYEEFYGPWYEDIRRRVPDISKAKRILGYAPRVSLGQGLRRTLEWYKRRPERLRQL